MVGMEQICRGAMKYVTRELVPLVSSGKGILLEAFAPAVINANVKKYMSSSWLDGKKIIDIIDVINFIKEQYCIHKYINVDIDFNPNQI